MRPDESAAAALPAPLRAAVEGALGARVLTAEPVGNGYTPARRVLVGLENGRTAFVKAATNADTADWLRQEARAYDALAGAPFLAERFAWHDRDGATFLVLEDLSSAHWPPPWSPLRIDSVLRALDAVHASLGRIPFALPATAADPAWKNWRRVAAEPAAFLSLGLCTGPWLDVALPALVAAEEAAPLEGDDLLHLDVRSDNICFTPDGRTVFVDWNWLCRGNGRLDVAGWLPSLRSEGGPEPEAVLPDDAGFAALLSGFWAFRAGTPPPPGAPRVREVQQRQLRVALPWTARALDLPPPDGVNW